MDAGHDTLEALRSAWRPGQIGARSAAEVEMEDPTFGMWDVIGDEDVDWEGALVRDVRVYSGAWKWQFTIYGVRPVGL